MTEHGDKSYLRNRRIFVYGLPFQAVRTIRDRFGYPAGSGNGSQTYGNLDIFNTDGFKDLTLQELPGEVEARVPDLLILGCYPQEGQDAFRDYMSVLSQLSPRHNPRVILVGAQSVAESQLQSFFPGMVAGTAFFPDNKGSSPTDGNYSYLLSKVEGVLSSNVGLKYRLGVIGAGTAVEGLVLDGLLKTEGLRFNSVNVYTRTRTDAEALRERVISLRSGSKNPTLDVVVNTSIEDVLNNSGIVLITAGDVKKEGTGDRTSMVYEYIRDIVLPVGNAVNTTCYNGPIVVFTNPPDILATALHIITRSPRISGVSVLDQLRPSGYITDALSSKVYELTRRKPRKIDLDFLSVHSLGFIGVVKDTIRVDGKRISTFGITDLENIINEALRDAAALPHTVRDLHGGVSPSSESAYALTQHLMALRRVGGMREILAGVNVNPLDYLTIPEQDEEQVRRLFPNGIFMGVPTQFSDAMTSLKKSYRRINGEKVPIKLRAQGSMALYNNLLWMRKILMDERMRTLLPGAEGYFKERLHHKRRLHKRKKAF